MPDIQVDQNQLRMLVADIAAGGDGPIDQLYRLTIRPLTRIANSVLRSYADAEEIADDALMYVWQHAGRYDPDRGTVMAWLSTIVRNRSIDRVRARKRALPFIEMVGPTSSLRYSGTAEHDLLAFQQALRVKSALADLSGIQQRLLALAFFEGLSHREIGNLLCMPSGSVKSSIRRGLRSMNVALSCSPLSRYPLHPKEKLEPECITAGIDRRPSRRPQQSGFRTIRGGALQFPHRGIRGGLRALESPEVTLAMFGIHAGDAEKH